MPSRDAQRWNQRYQNDLRSSFKQPRKLLLDNANLIPSTGLALDLAMGLGGNAAFLLQHGLRVIGVDISYVAVKKAKQRTPRLMAVVADLEHFQIPPNRFDVIIDFLYLQRGLWKPISLGLKKGGVLFIECLTTEMSSIHPEIDPIYLLKPGELRQSFEGEPGRNLEILYYHEGWQPTNTSHPRCVASLIVRRHVE